MDAITPVNEHHTNDGWTWCERLLVLAFVLLVAIAGTRLYGCKPVAYPVIPQNTAGTAVVQ